MAENKEIIKIRTVCPAHCGIDACGILAHIENGRVIKLEPGDFPDKKDNRICLRGLSSLDITYHPDRLKYPMKRVGKRGEGKFERITWDEALDIIARKFKEIADKYGWSSIGWTLGGPGAGMIKFITYLKLANLTGSTRVSAWGYGDSGLPCGSRVIFGMHLPYGILDRGRLDTDPPPELIVVWGTNPGESAPLLTMRRIMNAKGKGAQLVVVDPRFTVSASKADEWIPTRPGTDSALALGLMNVIFQKNLQNDKKIIRFTVGPYLVRNDNGKFLRGKDLGIADSNDYVVWDSNSNSAKTSREKETSPVIKGSFNVNGIECKPSFQLLLELANEYTPEKTSEITGVSAELIKKFAEKIGTSKTIFVIHMGFTRTYHGGLSARGVGTLASVVGSVRTSLGEGYIPAGYNTNVFLKASGKSNPRLGILNLYNAITKGEPFPIKAVWFSFINFVNQCAHSTKIMDELFQKLEFIVTVDLFMTTNAKYSDILLPACSFLEFSDYINHPFPVVQLQQKAIEPLYESKSDVDIACGLAERLGYGEYFKGGEEKLIKDLMSSPSLTGAGITYESLKEKGAILLPKIPKGMENQDMQFRTPSGRIEIYAEQLVEDGQELPVYLNPLESPDTPIGKKYPLTFIQGHSKFHTHSSFANVKSLLKMNPEPVVDIHPADAEKRDINDGDMVTVLNDRARTTLKVRVTEEVRPGVVNIAEGWWFDQFKEGSVNHLTHDTVNPVQNKIYEPNMHMNDVAVEVVKYKEGRK
ncbi:MAG: molybdopterin-containing oxidoreductase family protein [Promethearchaeota archaeon]